MSDPPSADPTTPAPAPATAPTASAAPSFPGYEIRGELGRGGMGVVYRAFDVRRGEVVALKTLHHAGPAALYRFKHEFRALAGVAHPNIASLYELHAEEGLWFFTMELVEGEHFLDHVRFGTDLRKASRQLAEGLSALHATGLLHRDVKPSNVLVRKDCRVVLLDFGLAAEIAPDGTHQSTARHVLGTAAYMSPEQAIGSPVSTASDWYSFGVMLYEAMTGRLPYDAKSGGDVFRALLDPTTPPPRPPTEHSPGAPQDLSDLAVALLRREPAARPVGADVLRVLESAAPIAPRRALAAGELVGRGTQLASLHAAFDEMRTGRAVFVFVHGASGIGKTALVEKFLEEATSRHDAVVLAGRCYERESVPFKALDSPIDALSRFLSRLAPHDVDAFLPRDVAPLTRLFPVLLRVEAVASAARRTAGAAVDPEELRRRAALALRELLARIGDRRALVLLVDDLQWGDADSAGLVRDVLRPPDAPHVLFVGSYRRDDAERSPFLASVRISQVATERRDVPVDPLTPDESATLASALSEGRVAPGSAVLAAVVRESRGSPLFVRELIDHASGGAPSSQAPGDLTLDEALASRAGRLPDEARRLLDVVCVAGRPIDESLALRASAPLREPGSALALLLSGRFLRGQEGGEARRLDTYHDRVRESVLARLSGDALAELHARLATAMEASGHPEPEQFAIHLDGAGVGLRAGEQYARAASVAADAQAFDHAARLLARAVALTPRESAGYGALLRRLADALARAGRGAEAAPHYLAAAGTASEGDALALRSSAASALLASGHIDAWAAAIRPVFAAAGISLSERPAAAMTRTIVRVLYRRVRGYSCRVRRESDVDPSLLRRIDILNSNGPGLVHLEPARGMELMTLEAALALRAGEPYRLAKAIAPEATMVATRNVASWQRQRKNLRLARELAIRSGREDAVIVVDAWTAGAEFFAGRWRTSHDLWVDLRKRVSVLPAASRFISSMADHYLVRACIVVGLLNELARVLPASLDDADRRGDFYLATSIRTCSGHALPLRADQPDLADEAAGEALSRWESRGFRLPHAYAAQCRIDAMLYRGAFAEAVVRVADDWPSIATLQIMRRIQFSRLSWILLRARTAVAAASIADGDARRRLLRRCDADCKSVLREDAEWGRALAHLVLGAAACVRGDEAKSLSLLHDAERGLAAADMALHAAASRRRRGELLGGDEGRALVASANAAMAAEGVRNPEAWTRMYAPGFDR